MKRAWLFVVFLCAALQAFATVFGTVRGILHDPQHRPVSGIQVILKAKSSEFTQNVRTDDAGQFHFDAVPLGEYTVAISEANFVADQQSVAVLSAAAPILHFELRLPTPNETVLFNAAPRPGFEHNSEDALVLSAANFYQTDDQINFGGHSNRFAYYGSVSGNRTNLGLQTPTSAVQHDAANGFGGFTSLIFNLDPQDQLRLIAQSRRDFYQVPNDPSDPTTILRDANRESDSFAAFSWVRTFSSGLVLTVSPFFHYNSANYRSDPNDIPSAATQDRSSKYGVGHATAFVPTTTTPP